MAKMNPAKSLIFCQSQKFVSAKFGLSIAKNNLAKINTSKNNPNSLFLTDFGCKGPKMLQRNNLNSQQLRKD